MPTQKKKEIVAKLCKQLEDAEAIYLTDYQGLTHQELEQLRSKIKEQNADYTIVKNTLFQIAIKSVAFKEFESDALKLTGPTAVLFAYDDPIKPLQAFTEFVKQVSPMSHRTNAALYRDEVSGTGERLKAAIAFGEYLTNAQLQKLVDLEPEEILQAKLVSQLASPLYKLAYALNWNMQRLVLALSEIKKQKESTN